MLRSRVLRSSLLARPGFPDIPFGWMFVLVQRCGTTHRPKRFLPSYVKTAFPLQGRKWHVWRHAARDHKIGIVIGINERVDHGPAQKTLYNSLLIFTPDGRLANHHPKLMPTFTERLVWGQGDGSGLASVQVGPARIGGLICWEHWMPLARMAMHQAGEDIHIALWPTVNEVAQLASRHYAFEGRCFVLAVGLMMPTSDIPSVLPHQVERQWVERGGSVDHWARFKLRCCPDL